MKLVFSFLLFISILSLSTISSAATESISKQEAVEIATQSYPGRVLSVKKKSKTYKVKILSDSGKIRVIRVDTKKGKINSSSKAKKNN